MLHSNSIVRRSLLCLVGLTLAAGTARGQEYKVTLVRPAKVGEQYVTTIKAKLSSVNPEKSEDFTADLHGTVKVLAVNEKTGSPTKISCKVDKITKDDKEVFPAGTVITADKSGAKTAYTVDDKPVADADKSVLDALLDVSSPDKTASDDEIFGTDKPQKVGDSWPVNKELLAKDMSEGFLPLPAESVQGESTLVEVKKVKDVDSMVVKSSASSTMNRMALPNGATVDGKLEGSQTVTLPVDKSLPPTTVKSKFTMKMTVAAPGGAGPNIDVKADLEKTEEREAVKP
jgi:hypothetical protein